MVMLQEKADEQHKSLRQSGQSYDVLIGSSKQPIGNVP